MTAIIVIAVIAIIAITLCDAIAAAVAVAMVLLGKRVQYIKNVCVKYA